MKLESLISFLQPRQPAAAETGAQGGAAVKTGRAGAPGFSNARSNAKPDATTDDASGNPVDIVQVSVQATYMLAAQQFDPRQISGVEARDLAELLFQSGAIDQRDKSILSEGPEPIGLPKSDPLQTRDFILGFQEQMATGLGESNPRAVNDNSRALTILGRVAAIRERLLNE